MNIFLLIALLVSLSLWGQERHDFVVAEFLFCFGTGGAGEGELKNPQAIAADPQGYLYIADSGNNRIQKFDSHGRFLTEVGGLGWGKEQFDYPTDICAKSGLDVFVADYNNNRIERYDRKLNYISSLEGEGERLHFAFPRGVDISSHGDLFIVDSDNNRILKINSFGEVETSFGDVESGEGKLEKPVQVYVSRTDFIYVCDEGKGQVVVYDYFGNYVRCFGEGQLRDPKGIFFQDDTRRLFVADHGNNRIVAFEPSGRMLPIIVFGSEKHRSFERPTDLVIVHRLMYVLESDKNRVCVFRLQE